MADESFLMVSLDEKKSKDLAQVLSNNTARKILDLLSKKGLMTETEIAETLKIPLSTTHYNTNLLVKAGLVKDDHYRYSKKGKKIIHYSLSNKYVIITPKKTDNIRERLKDFLPVIFIMVVISLGMKLFSTPISPRVMEEAMIAEADTAAMALKTVAESQPAEFAIWFLAGGILALVLYFIWKGFNSRGDRNF